MDSRIDGTNCSFGSVHVFDSAGLISAQHCLVRIWLSRSTATPFGIHGHTGTPQPLPFDSASRSATSPALLWHLGHGPASSRNTHRWCGLPSHVEVCPNSNKGSRYTRCKCLMRSRAHPREELKVRRPQGRGGLSPHCTKNARSLDYARDFGCGLPLRSRPQSASSSSPLWAPIISLFREHPV